MCGTRSVNRCVGLGLLTDVWDEVCEQMCGTRSVNRCVGLGLLIDVWD